MSESIGAQLIRSREARGLSTAEAAAGLHCDPKVIAALEDERWADLGAPVFSRGHLRRYAEFLGLPADALLARWTAEQGAHQALPDLSRAPQAPRPLDTQRWARRLAMVAGAAVIALAAWWILQGAGVRPAPQAAAPDASAGPPVATAIPQEPGPTAVMPADPTAVVPADPTAPVPPPAASPVVESPVVESPVDAPPGAGVSLAFTATERCWAEVIDATGARRLYTMLEPGMRVTTRGAPPLRVVLGRGDVTALEIDGRAAVIPADALRNAVARFEVAGSGAMRALPPEPTPAARPVATPSAAPAQAAPTQTTPTEVALPAPEAPSVPAVGPPTAPVSAAPGPGGTS